jgi:hypothetical protein
MFDFNIIMQRLNDLSNWKNTVIANSKKIFQLPIATAGVKKIAVYNESSLTTEQFNLTDALNGFNLLNDKITAYGTISRVANVFTYSVGYQWILGGLNYANASDIDITVNDATDGFFRIDIVVVDTNNQIYLIQGFESDSVASQPQTPPDTLLLNIINIFGDNIDSPVIIPSNFVNRFYYGLIDCYEPIDGVFTAFQWLNAPISGDIIATLDKKVYSPDWISVEFTTIEENPRKWTANRYDGTTWTDWELQPTLNDVNEKLPIEVPQTTGVALTFATDRVYGSVATPETGNITASTTGAKIGVTNIIIHNSGTAPTFDSKFKKLSGSGSYVISVVNYIYCTYITSTEIIYSINQRT